MSKKYISSILNFKKLVKQKMELGGFLNKALEAASAEHATTNSADALLKNNLDEKT